MKYDEYLKTDYWSQVTKAVKERAGWKCQVCNSPHDLQAHHRTYEHRGNELRFLDDLIAMCRRCHGVFHGKIAIDPIAKLEAPKRKPKQTKRRLKSQPIDPTRIVLDMPPNDGEITLTRELVTRLRTNGSFTTATLEGLGVTDLSTGWPKRLIGQRILASRYKAALEGRFQYA